MTDTIDLPGGHSAQLRTDLNGGDQRWFLVEREKLILSNGTGKPARQEVDPDNPAVLMSVPAEPAYLTMDDNITMLDMVAGRLLVSATLAGMLPWRLPVRDQAGNITGPGTRDELDLDVVNIVDDALGKQMDRLRGVTAGPKPKPSGPTSASTSTESAPALLTAPIPATSSTPPGS